MINRNQEKGFATIVFIMLVGLAITATGTGVMHSVKSTQQKSIAVNSITHSQTGAWVGAEAFRLYLSQQDVTGITTLLQNVTIGMDPSYGSITASNIQVTNMGSNTYRVSADIVNIHAAARSSAALNVVYEVQPGSSGAGTITPPEPIDAVDFNDDLKLNGSLTLIAADGGKYNLNVNGDVELGGARTNALGTINSTGTVTLGSSVTVDNIYANDDVVLNNTTVDTVSTLGYLTANNATIDQIYSNHDVTIVSGGPFSFVSALENVYSQNSQGHGYINAGESVTITNDPVDRLEAVGEVTLNSGAEFGDVVSMDDITCVGTYWNNFTSLSANGSLHNCDTSSGNAQSGASRTVTPMTPLEPYTLTATVVDVWTVRNAANYIVTYDDTAGRIKVTVNNVAGIVNGSEYFVGDYSHGGTYPNYRDYLCETVNGSGTCTAPAEPLTPICIHESLYNSGCISYSMSSNTFTVNPSTTAPGIMWIDGDVTLGNGFGMTTVLATGNIVTNNRFKSWSANYGGYDKICLADNSHMTKGGPVKQRYTQVYSEHYPTNLCDIDNSVYMSDGTGNIALAAGGIDPDGDGSYSGGNISLGASTEVTGAVLAGNLLDTSGNTTVYGVVASSAAGESNANGNSLGSSTTIDLSRGTNTYDPSSIPDMSGTTTAGVTTAPINSVSRMLWVKYL